MKYFTKEWYRLAQCLDYTICMKSIADKKYSDEDIAALYDKKLKAEIADDRRQYNAPPQFIEIDFDDAELDDFVLFDEKTGKLKRPESLESVKRNLEQERTRARKDFANRPPFNPQKTIERFEAAYQGGLKYGYMRYPDWVKETVDIRLVALGFLPKSVYDRLKTEEKQNKAAFDKITKAAQKALNKENRQIPERISSEFGWHDSSVLSLEQANKNLIILIKTEGAPFEGETPYVRVTFTDGKIVERDKNLSLETRFFENDDVQNDTVWLYDELYKTENGFEAHMMFVNSDLCYLTVTCDDIVIERNVEVGIE
ncbi:MAG: DUF4085 domain-containing protein [Corallococcus sp.]|nr:DUF4085 domain-containing protein [Corallococcus sp.]